MLKAVLGLVVFFFSVISVFAGNEVTGKQLPSLVKTAIKRANQVSFVYSGETIKTQLVAEQVVLVSNMDEFCSSRQIASSDCQKFGLAFVVNGTFPVYLNGDSVRTQSNYQQVETAYNTGMNNISYFIASLLVHESYHAQGHSDESGAYGRELAYITACSDGLKGAVWLPGYLEQLRADVRRFDSVRDDSLKVAVNTDVH